MTYLFFRQIYLSTDAVGRQVCLFHESDKEPTVVQDAKTVLLEKIIKFSEGGGIPCLTADAVGRQACPVPESGKEPTVQLLGLRFLRLVLSTF